jgi:two-component system, cell cycle sensor histidine kinase and response regulator CckA
MGAAGDRVRGTDGTASLMRDSVPDRSPDTPLPPSTPGAANDRARWLGYVAEASTDLVAVIGRGGELCFVGGGGASHLGYSPGSHPGASVASLLHPEDVRRFLRAACTARRSPGAVRRGVGRLRHATGAWCTHEIALTVPRDGGGEMVVCARDLSATERLERQLQRAQNLQVVGETTTSLVHDFSNLVVLMRCGADMALRRLPPDSDVRRDLESLLAAGEDATRLARQILDFARGSAAPEGPTPMNRVIRDTLPVLAHALHSTGVRVEAQLDDAVGSATIGETQLQQVVVNLVLNARDAMPDGGTLSLFSDRVCVAAPVLPPFPSALRPGWYLRLEVTDSGVGMDEELRMRIFDPFFTTKAEGTGLGLHAIRSILHRYEGCIWVESRVGAGSTFTVLLPEHAPAGEIPTGTVVFEASTPAAVAGASAR